MVPGDIFVLCSDGLSGQLPPRDRRGGHRAAAGRGVPFLVDLANLHGGPDNITVIVVQVPGKPERAIERSEKAAAFLWCEKALCPLRPACCGHTLHWASAHL